MQKPELGALVRPKQGAGILSEVTLATLRSADAQQRTEQAERERGVAVLQLVVRAQQARKRAKQRHKEREQLRGQEARAFLALALAGIFRGGVVGPLSKTDYIRTMELLGIADAWKLQSNAFTGVIPTQRSPEPR